MEFSNGSNIDTLKPEEFKTYLKRCLQKNLPAKHAHSEMAPQARSIPDAAEYEQNYPRESSVLIPIYSDGNQWFLCFIKRPQYDGVHSGQIALPGGASEETDQSIEDTALREAFEEVNIREENVTILGHISPLYVSPSNYIVRPVIGLLTPKPFFIPQPSEVAEILELPLSAFLDRKNIIVKEFPGSQDNHIKAPCYNLNGIMIWGATAMIMNEFLTLLK